MDSLRNKGSSLARDPSELFFTSLFLHLHTTHRRSYRSDSGVGAFHWLFDSNRRSCPSEHHLTRSEESATDQCHSRGQRLRRLRHLLALLKCHLYGDGAPQEPKGNLWTFLGFVF